MSSGHWSLQLLVHCLAAPPSLPHSTCPPGPQHRLRRCQISLKAATWCKNLVQLINCTILNICTRKCHCHMLPQAARPHPLGASICVDAMFGLSRRRPCCAGSQLLSSAEAECASWSMHAYAAHLLLVPGLELLPRPFVGRIIAMTVTGNRPSDWPRLEQQGFQQAGGPMGVLLTTCPCLSC